MNILEIGDRWIRKNKNVQVGIWALVEVDGEATAVTFMYNGNGHTRHMNVERFLSEFVSIESLKDITEGSKWLSKRDGRQFYVCELMNNQGTVKYRCKDDPQSIHYRCNIGQFKKMFKLDLSEVAK